MSTFIYWFKKGSFSLINRVATFLLGFSTYLLLVRYFDKADFGIYSLYFTIVTLIEMARNSFLQNAFTKFYCDEQNLKAQVLCSSLSLNILLTLLSAGFVTIFSSLIGVVYGSSELGDMLFLYGVSSILLIPSTQLIYYFGAHIKFKYVAIISNMRYLAFFLLVLFSFLWLPGLTVYNIVQLSIVGIAIGSVVSLLFLAKVSERNWSLNVRLLKEMFHFGKYTLGVGITSMTTRSIDQLMIGFFISTEAVASYNIARRFLNMIEVPINAIANISYPKMAKSFAANRGYSELSRLYEQSSGYSIGFILPFIMVLMLFPGFLIYLIAGVDYLDAIPVLQILLTYHLFKPLAVQSGGVLEILGRPKVGFVLLIVQTLLNVTLNYFLIRWDGPFGGVIGASIASLLSGFVYLALLLQVLNKHCDFSLVRILKDTLNLYQMIFSKVFGGKQKYE